MLWFSFSLLKSRLSWKVFYRDLREKNQKKKGREEINGRNRNNKVTKLKMLLWLLLRNQKKRNFKFWFVFLLFIIYFCCSFKINRKTFRWVGMALRVRESFSY